MVSIPTQAEEINLKYWEMYVWLLATICFFDYLLGSEYYAELNLVQSMHKATNIFYEVVAIA